MTVDPGPFRGKSVNAIVARLRPNVPVCPLTGGRQRSWEPEVLYVGVMC